MLGIESAAPTPGLQQPLVHFHVMLAVMGSDS